MGLFSRRAAPVEANTATTTNQVEKPGRRGIMSRHERNPSTSRHGATGAGALHQRPTFGQWVKGTWLDILTMAAMGAIGLGVYMARPAPSRSFPISFSDGEIVYPEFAYPLRHEIVPIWAAALLAALVPIFFFLVMQIRIRSFWDVNNAVLGLLYALITAAVFQVFLKWLIGGLRPHFLAVCKPNIPPGTLVTGNGYREIMFQRDICTGDEKEINDSLESFPSGHTTAAFAGFVFLYLYLNAKLKVWSNYHPAMWKLIVTYMPILGAVLIGGALTIDEFHNWYDILAGAIIGTVMAFSAYRMVYASVWDFRFNHIPLVRHIPFTYSSSQHEFGGFHPMTFTRKAGWGHPSEAGTFSGAPFDASHFAGAGAGQTPRTLGDHGTGTGYSNGTGAGYSNGTGTGYSNGATTHHDHHDHHVAGTTPTRKPVGVMNGQGHHLGHDDRIV